MQSLYTFFEGFLEHAQNVFTSPLDPGNRIYVLYLATSVLFAYFIYRVAVRKGTSENGSFLRFLFPKHVWEHPSAWLDVRYFFFHQLIGHFLLIGLSAGSATIMFKVITGGTSLPEIAGRGDFSTWADIGIATVYMIVSIAVVDLVGYYMHYLQHKIPILWQFHKVHHSAEVMHPMSNFREHPVDNLAYGVFVGAGYGAVSGFAVQLFGYLPSTPTLLGVPLLMLAFNLLGYNLRHSHVWLKWPGRFSMIFPSPAHHHVHHSCHPDHIDKNFAFMFPIWDVIFKTYHMPQDNRDVKFGIGDGNADELDTCARLYYIPVRDAYRLVRKSFSKDKSAPDSPPVKSDVPAE
ncbi:MAG: sterol desaturase family protein [Paracoccaceae bacterium]